MRRYGMATRIFPTRITAIGIEGMRIPVAAAKPA